jgi:hypothetical protein
VASAADASRDVSTGKAQDYCGAPLIEFVIHVSEMM